MWNEIEIELKETKSTIFILRIVRGLNAKNLSVYCVIKFI